MPRFLSSPFFVVVFILFFAVSARATMFPDFRLNSEFSAQQAQTLGIPQTTKAFSPYDVKTDFLIVEIFSMYCPHCQRQAPIMNEFMKMLHQSSYADKFGVVGIGAGNSDFEVGIFRDEYKIDFPLISDEDFTAYTATGEHGTPHFFLIDMRNGKNRGAILYEHDGVFPDPKEFLDDILAETDLKK
ncbi:peroxiredoxin family protein [Desulfovibrio inopinatus]|uniref:peroxiredoxin family protein n=1 Tax=Desulfovibrio inopinatus TaxID=102109 RepID=UPI000406CC9A|nr:TlpA disulfide reductase family protein [Desulfovibrio inopinatus]